MSRFRQVAVALLLVLPSLSLAGRGVRMTNPSFEETQGKPEGPAAADWEPKGPAPGWHVWIGSTARRGKPRIAWPSTGGRTGRRCVSLTGCVGPVCVIQSVPVSPEASYEARVWIKASSKQSRCCLSIRFQKADRKWAKGTQRVKLPANAMANEWSELRVVFKPAKEAAFAVFLLTADGQKPTETCWFDDVSLIEFDPGELVIGNCGWIHPNCLPQGQPAVTPHVPWAKPWAGKRAKVLFLVGSDHNLREPIELAQRMDIEHDCAFAHEFEPTVFAFNDREVADRIASQYYDVIVVAVKAPAIMLAKLSDHTRGLVLVQWPGMRPKLPKDVKLAAVGSDSPLAEALDALPPLGERPSGAVGPIRTGELGRARVVQIEYRVRSRCLTPNVSFDNHLRMAGEYWEAYLQTLARAILHAAGASASAEVNLAAKDNTALLRVSGQSTGRASVLARFCDKLGRARERRLSLDLSTSAECPIESPDGSASGQSTVIVALRDAKGRSLGFAATRIDVQAPTRITAVQPDRPYYEDGQPVIVKVDATGELAGIQAEATLTDAYGRTHARAATGMDSGTASLTLAHVGKLSAFNWLTVRLLRGKAELDASRTYVLAPQSREEFLDDYQVGTWACSSYMSAYLHPTLHRLMREAGVTLGIQARGDYASMLAGRMGIISTAYGRIPGYSRHTTTEPVRKRCLNDPSVRELMAKTAREVAEDEIGARPVFGYIRDETSLVQDSLAVDVCACPHCAARFREWLQKRYDSLDELNAHWHTSYKSWDDLGFITYDQVRGKDTFARWVMFRRFEEWAWADGIRWANKNAREADPGALLALPNTFGQVPFVGRDYWLLAQANAYTMEYPTETRSSAGNRAVFDTLRCFNPATRHHPWMGYRFDEPVIRFVPWWTAFHGATGAAVYGTMSFFAGKNSWAQIVPTLQHTKRGLMYAEELGELKRGIGKLIMHAQRPSADVAILWSQAAMHIGWAMSEQTSTPSVSKLDPYSQHFASRRAFRLALLESWRQFDYVCEEQIRKGALDRYKWLLMPAVYGVDDDVAGAIEQFAENGGTIVADMGVGLTNEAGARLQGETQLTRLFGFARSGRDLDYQEREAAPTNNTDTITATLPHFNAIGRESINPISGSAVGTYGDGRPLFVVRGHGNGATVFMNCRAPDSPALVRLFDSLPRLATLSFKDSPDRLAGYELVRFGTGRSALLGILRDYRVEGPDEPIAVALADACHVYDVRAGNYLGHSNRFECKLALGGAGLFALLPYRVDEVTITCPASARPGSRVEVSLLVRASAAVGYHVMRLDVRRPDGKLAEAYGMNLAAAKGKARAVIPFALNDAPGTWTLVARDVASGVEAEKAMRLGQP